MKKTKLKVPLVAVVWRDACHAMNPVRENTEPTWVVDCGFVVSQDKDRVILVREFFEDGSPRHSMTILKDNIEEIQRVGTATLPIHFVSAPFLGDSSE